jgi:hypothetical protein
MSNLQESFDKFIYSRCEEIEKGLENDPEFVKIEEAINAAGIVPEVDDLINRKIALVAKILYMKGFFEGQTISKAFM